MCFRTSKTSSIGNSWPVRWELGMQMHQVDVEPLLEKMGIDYDPAAKYLGRHGKFIGKPAPSAVNCGVQDMIYNIKAQ